MSVLRAKYGAENVIATDIKKPAKASFLRDGPFLYADVTDYASLSQIVVEHKIDWLIHNSSILSANGELNPQLALDVNVKGIQNALELARNHSLRILAPSSIAVFGPSTPKDNTPDSVIMRPSTIYGLTKVHLELLGEYYFSRYNVDFRSLRYPGVISSEVNVNFKIIIIEFFSFFLHIFLFLSFFFLCYPFIYLFFQLRLCLGVEQQIMQSKYFIMH